VWGRSDQYGGETTDPDNSCGRDANDECSARGVYKALRQFCFGKSVCEFYATNEFFGTLDVVDPCVNTYKYLNTSYGCRV